MNQLTLSIEAAIGTGSISITSSEGEIDRSFGNIQIGRAESLLSEIATMLDRNDLDANDFSQIAVSLGPGSYTGIKIGIATAMGLARATSTECLGTSATEAMLELSMGDVESVCIIPIGRDLVCEHRFDRSQNECYQPRIVTFLDIVKSASEKDCEFIVHRHLIERFSSLLVPRLIDAGENLAGLIARRVLRKKATSILNPVFAKAA